MKKLKLNQRGISHFLVPLLVVVVVAIGGVYMLVGSHAEAPGFIDISWPQCSREKSIGHYGYGIVGVNGKTAAFSSNPCLRKEVRHFDTYDLYVGTNYPSAHCSRKLSPAACGAKAAQYDLRKTANYHPGTYWIDVEGDASQWRSTPSDHMDFLRGMHDYLHVHSGASVGYYSTPGLWSSITGGASTDEPLWYAASYKNQISGSVHQFCSSNFAHSHTGVIYVQYILTENGVDLDHNIQC